MKVVVNDIDGNLTNLYCIIQKRPSDLVSELMNLPYSEVIFKKFIKDLNSGQSMTDLDRAVAYYYVRFGAFRGRIDNPTFRFSTVRA